MPRTTPFQKVLLLPDTDCGWIINPGFKWVTWQPFEPDRGLSLVRRIANGMQHAAKLLTRELGFARSSRDQSADR